MQRRFKALLSGAAVLTTVIVIAAVAGTSTPVRTSPAQALAAYEDACRKELTATPNAAQKYDDAGDPSTGTSTKLSVTQPRMATLNGVTVATRACRFNVNGERRTMYANQVTVPAGRYIDLTSCIEAYGYLSKVNSGPIRHLKDQAKCSKPMSIDASARTQPLTRVQVAPSLSCGSSSIGTVDMLMASYRLSNVDLKSLKPQAPQQGRHTSPAGCYTPKVADPMPASTKAPEPPKPNTSPVPAPPSASIIKHGREQFAVASSSELDPKSTKGGLRTAHTVLVAPGSNITFASCVTAYNFDERGRVVPVAPSKTAPNPRCDEPVLLNNTSKSWVRYVDVQPVTSCGVAGELRASYIVKDRDGRPYAGRDAVTIGESRTNRPRTCTTKTAAAQSKDFSYTSLRQTTSISNTLGSRNVPPHISTIYEFDVAPGTRFKFEPCVSAYSFDKSGRLVHKPGIGGCGPVTNSWHDNLKGGPIVSRGAMTPRINCTDADYVRFSYAIIDRTGKRTASRESVPVSCEGRTSWVEK